MSASEKLIQAAAGNVGGGNKWLSIAASEAYPDDMVQASDMTTDSDDNIYIAGGTNNRVNQAGGSSQATSSGLYDSTASTTYRSPYVAKLSPTGDLLWAKTYRDLSGNGQDSFARNIAVNNSGRVLITTQNQYYDTTRAGLMLIDASDGNYLAGANMNNNASDTFVAYSLATDGSNFLVAGSFRVSSVVHAAYALITVGSGSTITTPGYIYAEKDAASPTGSSYYTTVKYNSAQSEFTAIGFGPSGRNFIVTGINTSGSLTGRYYLNSASFTDAMVISSDGNDYYYLSSAGLLVKRSYNSNLATMFTAMPTWAVAMSQPSYNYGGTDLKLSSDGAYLYVVNESYGVVKLNTSDGSVVSQKTFASINTIPENYSGAFGTRRVLIANDSLYILRNDRTGNGNISVNLLILPEEEFDDYEYRLEFGAAALDPDSGQEVTTSVSSQSLSYVTGGASVFVSLTTTTFTNRNDYDYDGGITSYDHSPNNFVVVGAATYSSYGTTSAWSLYPNSATGAGFSIQPGDILIYFTSIAQRFGYQCVTTTSGYTTLTTLNKSGQQPGVAVGYQVFSSTQSSNYVVSFSGDSVDNARTSYILLIRDLPVTANFSATANNQVFNTLNITPTSVTAPNKGILFTFVAASSTGVSISGYSNTDPNNNPTQFNSTYTSDTYTSATALGAQYVNSAGTVTLPEYVMYLNPASNAGAHAVTLFLDTE